MITNALIILAVAMIETGSSVSFRNTHEDAVGPMQVRPAVVRDVNRHYGLSIRHEECVDLETAALVFFRYGSMYNADSPEKLCRIWNGGPRGMSKAATKQYWIRARNVLESLLKGEWKCRNL